MLKISIYERPNMKPADKRYTKQGWRIHEVEIICRLCDPYESWKNKTHVGQQLTVVCPRCGTMYQLGDVGAKWMFMGGEIPRKREGFPEIAYKQTTMGIKQEGINWARWPVVVFDLEIATDY